VRARPIGYRLRRDVGRRRGTNVRWLLVHDVGNLGRTRCVGFPRVLEHGVSDCNPDTISVVRKADLKVDLYESLYGSHS
jgi:hypothetical protein